LPRASCLLRCVHLNSKVLVARYRLNGPLRTIIRHFHHDRTFPATLQVSLRHFAEKHFLPPLPLVRVLFLCRLSTCPVVHRRSSLDLLVFLSAHYHWVFRCESMCMDRTLGLAQVINRFRTLPHISPPCLKTRLCRRNKKPLSVLFRGCRTVLLKSAQLTGSAPYTQAANAGNRCFGALGCKYACLRLTYSDAGPNFAGKKMFCRITNHGQFDSCHCSFHVLADLMQQIIH